MTNTGSTKEFSWRLASVISLGVGLLVAGSSIFLQTHTRVVQALSFDGPTPVAASTNPVGTGSSYEKPGVPVRLIIPSIGVDANIQRVGLAWQGTGDMGIPTNFTDVGWYDQGPRPGMPGSAVIDGHLDGRNVREAVFYDLAKLQPGDMVEVIDQAGTVRQFRVTGSKTYDYNATTTEIFAGDVTKAGLNLVTCTGAWIKSQKLYDKRTVVFTEFVGIKSQ